MLDAMGRMNQEVPDGLFTFATPPDGVALGTPAGWRWISELLDRLKPTILVLDTIASLTGESIDASDAGDVVPFMRHLHDLRDKRSLVIFGLHHTRKQGNDAKSSQAQKADAMLGSQAWRSMSDAVLMLDAQEGDTTDVSVKLVKTKDLDQPAPPFHATLKDGLFRFLRWADDEAQPIEKPKRESKVQSGAVLRLLLDKPDGVQWEGIYVKLGYPKATWFRHRARILTELAGKADLRDGLLVTVS